MFERIEPTQKVSHRVVGQMITRIAHNEVQAGERLPSEAALAEQFGVGVSSVREALAILEGLNVIETRQGSGRVVRGLTFAALSDPTVGPSLVDGGMLMHIYEVRATLEAQIASLAAERANDEDIARIEAAVEAMDTTVAGGEDGLDQDQDFHRALAKATHNPVFQWLDEALQFLTTESRRVGLVKGGRPKKAAAEHGEILDAVRQGDAASARSIIAKHLESTRQDALRRLQAEHDVTS